MFVRYNESRYEGDELWGDSRIAGTAPNFCLCSSCSKSNITEGVICPIHEEFMEMTQKLKVCAPVFGCPDFKELEGAMNYLDQYWDEERLTLHKVGVKKREYAERIRKEWDAQMKYWESKI